MQKFINSYLRIFYENVIGETKYQNQKIGIISLKDFFKNIIIVKDNLINESNNNIILETKNVDYGNEILNLINNAIFGQQIKKSDILVSLNKNWTFFEKYKNSNSANRIPILVYKFDFSTNECINMFRHLNEDDVNKIGEETLINSFHENIESTTHGFINNLGNCIIMCFNKPIYTFITIQHELTHYFQEILNVNLFKSIKNNFNFIDIPELNLTKQQFKKLFNYAFSKNEFPAHLYVNIIDDLNFIYEKFYSNISRKEFINTFINDLLKFKKNIFKSKIGKKFYIYINDKSSITILALSAEFKFHLKTVLKALRSEFN